MNLKKLAIGILTASVTLWAGDISLQIYGNTEYSGNFKNRMRGAGGRLNIRPFDNGFFFGAEGNYLGYLKYKHHYDKVTNYLFNMGYELFSGSTFVPFGMVGYGYQHVKDGAEPFQSGNIAQGVVGVKYNLFPFLHILADVKYVRDIKNKIDNWGADLGLGVSFGTNWKSNSISDQDGDGVPDEVDLCANTPKGVKVDANGCPLDDDKDGVPNYLDKCPKTPKGVRVDKKGCPIDSDGDGVPDYLDKCKNTPYGAKVNKNGCPDSDGDGVYDDVDRCPNTPHGVEVDEVGCPKIVLKKNKYGELTYRFEIHFPFNSAKILPKYVPEIQKFAQWLNGHQEVKAEIQGHTDSIGSERYNLILSTRRAKAVYKALLKENVDPKRLNYKGYGESHPIASNKTKEGRALNRRVVAKILNPNATQSPQN